MTIQWGVRQFTHSSLIPASREVVFGFHERPDALERLSPAFPPMKVLRKDPGLAAGSVVELQLGWGPLSVRWTAHHIAYRPPALFVDEMRQGPFAAWVHAHQFAEEGEGTRLTDSVEYALPGGAVVEAVLAPVVEWQLRQMFRFRHAQTRKYCTDAEALRGSEGVRRPKAPVGR